MAYVFVNALLLLANIAVLGCTVKLYTDFVKTAVFTKKGGGI